MSKFRIIWIIEDNYVEVIDQCRLLYEWVVEKLVLYKDVECVIKDMVVCGVLLIGVIVVYGIYLVVKEGVNMDEVFVILCVLCFIVVNLFWVFDRMKVKLENVDDVIQIVWNEVV